MVSEEDGDYPDFSTAFDSNTWEAVTFSPVEFEVTIPDVGLRTLLENKLGKNTGQPILNLELAGLTNQLAGQYSNISDLSSLKYCTGLTDLHLAFNNISQTGELLGLVSLNDLNLGSNDINDLSGLSALTNLTFLNLNDNQIDDIASLSNLTNLTSLNLNGNPLTVSASPIIQALENSGTTITYDPLPDAVEVTIPDPGLKSALKEAMDKSQDQTITDLDLVELTGSLDVSNAGIIDLTGLEYCINLDDLNLGNNQIVNLSSLSNLSSLASLSFYANKITDIGALSNLSSLTRLDLSHNQIIDIGGLASLANLTRLDLNSNPLNTESELTIESLRDSGTIVTDNLTESSTATINLIQGVNMIALPFQAETTYTAKSLAQHLAGNNDNLNDDSTVDVTWVIRYHLINQKFEAYVWSLDQADPGFEIQGGQGYIVHVSSDRAVTFEGGLWSGVLNPMSAPSSVIASHTWAFVVSGNLTDQIVSSDEDYRLQATNLTIGKQLAEVESRGHSFRLPLVDLNRQDLVVEGDLVEVKLIGSNGKRRAKSQFQVGQEELASAHRWLELESNPVPDLTRLLQNYPNPFNPETWIPYELSQDSEVKVWIYDVGGLLVRWMEVGFQEAGTYSSREKAIYWDGKNQHGEQISSGVYFYSLELGEENHTRRMVILK